MTLNSCELLTFTDVNNPNVTEEDFILQENAPEQTLYGLERQMALTLNKTIVLGEILSDNYFSNRTYSSKVFDKLTILSSDQDVRYFQQQIHALRELAQLGIEKVVPAHPEMSQNIEAEYYFFRGMSKLYAGEYFTYLPETSNGKVLSSAENINSAIDDFKTAVSYSNDAENITSYKLAQLRAYFRLGQLTNVNVLTLELSTIDEDFYRGAAYDGANSLDNEMQYGLYDSEYDELAPLPSLDFLDPKYFYLTSSSDEQSEVAYLKAEEVFLIKAEASIAESDLYTAQEALKKVLDIVSQRPQIRLNDSREMRNGGNRESFFSSDRGSYPTTSNYKVMFKDGATQYEHLILDRQESDILVSPISGTSVTAADVEAITSLDDLLYLVYKMRQEIFIAEGRRVTDLGIKLMIDDLEASSNENVLPEHTVAYIPFFISNLDLLSYPLDNFRNDTVNKVITIDYDMTKMIVDNKGEQSVVPLM